MASEPATRINVTFPDRLLKQLRKHIPPRERNQFIVSATEKELKRARLAAVLEDLRREPAWSEADHPDLKTPEAIDRYIRQLREDWPPYTSTPSSGEEQK